MNAALNVSRRSSSSRSSNTSYPSTSNRLRNSPQNKTHAKKDQQEPNPSFSVLLSETRSINSIAHQKQMLKSFGPVIPQQNQNWKSSASTQTNLLRDKIAVPETIFERQETYSSSNPDPKSSNVPSVDKHTASQGVSRVSQLFNITQFTVEIKLLLCPKFES